MTPEEIAAGVARINAQWGKPRRNYLAEILTMMADSGNTLIVDDGVVLCEPLVEVAVRDLGDGTYRAEAA